ncbi:alpha-(1-_3)-arabinofuranosyltransferase family protein [Patescibacteria group bacterium]
MLRNKTFSFMKTKHIQDFLALFIITLFSLISLTWGNTNTLIGSGDNFKSIDLYKYLNTLNTSWNGLTNTGAPEYSLEYHLPFSLIYFPLGTLGIHPVFIQKLWLVLSLLLPAFFMYKFITKFLGNKIPLPIRIITSLFYIFNPLMIKHPYGISLAKFPVYLALPLLCYLLISIFEATLWRDKLKFAIALSLGTLLMAASFGNVANIASAIIILGSLFVFEVFSQKNKLRHIALIIKVGILSLFLNFWWIYSSFYSQFMNRNRFYERVTAFKTNSIISDSLRLLGSWSLRAGHRGIAYFPFGQSYYMPIGILMTYLVTLLAFSSIVFLIIYRNRLNRVLRHKVLLFLFLSLLGIFLVKGSGPPFGKWYTLAYEFLPWFRMFREPYTKFSLITMFSFCIALTFSAYAFYTLIRKHVKFAAIFISVVFLSLFIGVAYPMFNGNIVVTHTNGVIKQSTVMVPSYWEEISRFTNTFQLQGRTLMVPNSGYYGASYIWKSGYSGRPFTLYYNGNTVTLKKIPPLNPGDVLIKHLYESLESYLQDGSLLDFYRFINLARILNIGNVLQQNDFDWRNISFENPINWSPNNMEIFFENNNEFFYQLASFGKFTETYLKSIPYIHGGENIHRIEGDPTEDVYLAELFGKNALELYSLRDDLKLPKIYIPNLIETFENEETFFNTLANTKYFNTKPLFVSDPQLSTIVPDQNIDITYEKKSYTRYRVYFSTPLKELLPVVFSETFDKEWYLAESCGILSCKKYANSKHFLANQYANGWLIKPGDEKFGLGSFYIVHKSEFRLKTGLIISGAFLLFSLCTIIGIGRKRKKTL